MRFAVTIGAFELSQFVEAGVCYAREVFGEDTPILISDDVSERSPEIEAVATRRKCHYWRSSGRMNHFAGDFQHLMNSLSFARQVEADIAVKISQRFWVLSPKIRTAAEAIFADGKISLALPGRPAKEQILGEKSFHGFPYLSDIVFMRAKAFEPDTLRVYYQTKFRNGRKIWDCFVETTVMDLVSQNPEAHRVFHELTEVNGGEPLFLRRYCATPQTYAKAAARFGITGHFPTGAWAKLERRYSPRPAA
jgi:hypothetical protein